MVKNLAAIALLAAVGLLSPGANGAEGTVAELVGKLIGSDVGVQVEALVALEAMGPGAADAVPALTEALDSDSAEVRAHAATALGAVGEAAKPAAEALASLVARDEDAVVRRAVVAALGQIRPDPAAMVPVLGRIMKDPDPAVRHRVLSALADRGAAAKDLLIQALGNDETAYWACLIISDVGPDLKDTVPALVKLLDHSDHTVQREAALALAAIGNDAASAGAKLEKMINDPIDGIPAIYALGAIGAVSADTRDRLLAKTQSGSPIERTVSAWALAKSHPNDTELVRQAVQLLVDSMQSDNPQVRLAAARGFEALDADPEIARPIMLKALENADEQTLLLMLDALAEFGPKLLPRMIKALDIEATRPYVCSILARMGAEAAPAVDALIKVLDDPNPKSRYEAMMALAAIGPAAKPAVPALKSRLVGGEEKERFAAAYALGRIGRDAIDAEPELLTLLAGVDENLAFVCACQLSRIDPESPTCTEKAVPLLVKGLGDASPQFRLQAAEALDRFGNGAGSAAEALRKALEDPDENVRKAVAEALKKLGQ